MNLKNMRKLRSQLRSRKNPVGFEMENYFRHNDDNPRRPEDILNAVEKHPCGTAACIAGHAVILALQSGDVPKVGGRINISDVAADWLDLSQEQKINLFNGYWNDGEFPPRLIRLTKIQAIAELTWLIEAEAP